MSESLVISTGALTGRAASNLVVQSGQFCLALVAVYGKAELLNCAKAAAGVRWRAW